MFNESITIAGSSPPLTLLVYSPYLCATRFPQVKHLTGTNIIRKSPLATSIKTIGLDYCVYSFTSFPYEIAIDLSFIIVVIFKLVT